MVTLLREKNISLLNRNNRKLQLKQQCIHDLYQCCWVLRSEKYKGVDSFSTTAWQLWQKYHKFIAGKLLCNKRNKHTLRCAVIGKQSTQGLHQTTPIAVHTVMFYSTLKNVCCMSQINPPFYDLLLKITLFLLHSTQWQYKHLFPLEKVVFLGSK